MTDNDKPTAIKLSDEAIAALNVLREMVGDKDTAPTIRDAAQNVINMYPSPFVFGATHRLTLEVEIEKYRVHIRTYINWTEQTIARINHNDREMTKQVLEYLCALVLTTGHNEIAEKALELAISATEGDQYDDFSQMMALCFAVRDGII